MLVSIVIPSYNHRQYVVQAIESVLDQDWPEIDLIVIDDGSKDGSSEVIQELLDRRGGFRFVARENRGLIKTLNQGLAIRITSYNVCYTKLLRISKGLSMRSGRR